MIRWRERDAVDVLNALFRACGAALQTLVDDTGLAEAYGRAARARSAEFIPAAAAAAFVALYERVLGRAGRGTS